METRAIHHRRFWLLCGMTLGAAATRLMPHPPNLTPIAALALFGGAHFGSAGPAFAVPLLAMGLSDAALALTVYGAAAFDGIPYVYPAFGLTVALGRWLGRRPGAARFVGASVAATLLFYAITNFGVWLGGHLYPRTREGLWLCYVAALPYLHNHALGNALYGIALFGGLWWAEHRFPALRARIPSPS